MRCEEYRNQHEEYGKANSKITIPESHPMSECDTEISDEQRQYHQRATSEIRQDQCKSCKSGKMQQHICMNE